MLPNGKGGGVEKICEEPMAEHFPNLMNYKSTDPKWSTNSKQKPPKENYSHIDDYNHIIIKLPKTNDRKNLQRN